MKAIRVMGIGLAIIISTFAVAQASGGGGATTSYYNTEIKTPNLGNYAFDIEAHEVPSHETLPIISKDYFPSTIARFTTEVDNTAPSATYVAKPITKVDVVFALGELSQMSQLESYMPTFEATLKSAVNNLDTQITSVETTKTVVDVNNASASTIYNDWLMYPNPNSYILQGDSVENLGGYDPRGGYNQAFIEAESFQCGDMTMHADITPHPNTGCGAGLVLHWNIETDRAYLMMVNSPGGCITGNQYLLVLYEINGMSKLYGGSAIGGYTGVQEAYMAFIGGEIISGTYGGVTIRPLKSNSNGGTGSYKVDIKGNNISITKSGAPVLDYTADNIIP